MAGRKPKLERNIRLVADYLSAGAKENLAIPPAESINSPIPDEEPPVRGTLLAVAAKYGISPSAAHEIISRVRSDAAQLRKAQAVVISIRLWTDSGNEINEDAISQIINSRPNQR